MELELNNVPPTTLFAHLKRISSQRKYAVNIVPSRSHSYDGAAGAAGGVVDFLKDDGGLDDDDDD
jgi:hypothetical protein